MNDEIEYLVVDEEQSEEENVPVGQLQIPLDC
jgi:hypothetical protein